MNVMDFHVVDRKGNISGHGGVQTKLSAHKAHPNEVDIIGVRFLTTDKHTLQY